ncbi:MAG: cytochrome B [Bacteroidota bacterium]
MYTGLLHTHSYLRYFILVMLIVVIVRSLLGFINKKPYTGLDNRLGLFLFILTHTQLLVGIVLFFVSPFVQFSSAAMKTVSTRYWLVEHNTAMLIAIVLITLARTTSKKMSAGPAKHKRMFIFNALALAIILVTIYLSGRKII